MTVITSVAQKKDLKRQKAALETLAKQADEEREKAKTAARERVLLEFEKGQRSLGSAATSIAMPVKDSTAEGECPANSNVLSLWI
jgi:nitric oxide synthase-interacting protein